MTEEQEHIARSAIQATLAACTQAGDAGKAEAYAACFTEDGVLDLGERIEGRAALRAWMGGPPIIPRPQSDTPKSAPGFVSHHLTTCRITLSGDAEAAARTYWFVITAMGLDHSGYYDDRLRRDAEGWRISYRRPRTLWFSPTSMVRPAP